MKDEVMVASINHDTGERSIDFYDDRKKAVNMAEMFDEDFPDRSVYVGLEIGELMTEKV